MGKARDVFKFRSTFPKTAAYARENGWEYVQGRKHGKLFKGKFCVTVSITPGDGYADAAALRDLIRCDTVGDRYAVKS